MSQEITNINEYPWLLFKLFGVTYAVNSKKITAITPLPTEVTIIPEKPENVRGLIAFRGTTINAIDTRMMFNINSIKSEYETFATMIDGAKQSHIEWIAELERCVTTNQQFTLATDHHKCSLGKWYDSFVSTSNLVNSHMRKLGEPHENLHKLVKEVYDVLETKEEEHNKNLAVKKIIDEGKDKYMTEVLDVLETSKSVFKTTYKEMVIVFENGEEIFGIIVDEVLSVDEIQILTGQNLNNSVFRSFYVNGIGLTKKTKDRVLLLDYTKITTL